MQRFLIVKFLIIFLSLIIFPGAVLTAARFPFPQGKNYPYGIKPDRVSQFEMNLDCQKAFDAWIQDWVTDEGAPLSTLRVHVGNDTGGFLTAYDTVSEGIAWGMLITLFMDNDTNKSRRYFDAFNNYRKNYLNQNGMMEWRIGKDGKIISKGGATEADENIALALLFAHYQWGSSTRTNYLKEAEEMINNIIKYEVEFPDYVLKPGDTWGGSEVLNPSYFSPAYYTIWCSHTGNKEWNKVRKKSYEILNVFSKEEKNVLFPDWCQADGTRAGNLDYHFGYNACQIPLKIGIDYIWFGGEEKGDSFKIINRISRWFEKETSGDPSKILDGYEIDGTKKGMWNNACFVGPLGVAAMCSKEYQNWCNNLYDQLRSYPDSCEKCYYCNTLRLVSLLVMSGNMPNLAEQNIVEK